MSATVGPLEIISKLEAVCDQQFHGPWVPTWGPGRGEVSQNEAGGPIVPRQDVVNFACLSRTALPAALEALRRAVGVADLSCDDSVCVCHSDLDYILGPLRKDNVRY